MKHPSNPASPHARGVTLIELLVVVAIIGILAGLLFPVFLRVREEGRKTSCISNMRQVGAALLLYAHDHDDRMPARINTPAINGGDAYEQPYDRLVAPYVKEDRVYACPGDTPGRRKAYFWDGSYRDRGLKRSYALAGVIATQEAAETGPREDENTGVVGRSLSGLTQASETLVLAEAWAVNETGQSDSAVGAINGAVLEGCGTNKLPGRKPLSGDPIDEFASCSSDYNNPIILPARGHSGLGNYAFADGHARSLSWAQVRRDDFRLFKAAKPQRSFAP